MLPIATHATELAMNTLGVIVRLMLLLHLSEVAYHFVNCQTCLFIQP